MFSEILVLETHKNLGLFGKGLTLKNFSEQKYEFLAPLAKGQRAIVMALCLSWVRPFIRPSVHCPSVHPSVNFLKKNFSSETIDLIFTKFHRNVP